MTKVKRKLLFVTGIAVLLVALSVGIFARPVTARAAESNVVGTNNWVVKENLSFDDLSVMVGGKYNTPRIGVTFTDEHDVTYCVNISMQLVGIKDVISLDVRKTDDMTVKLIDLTVSESGAVSYLTGANDSVKDLTVTSLSKGETALSEAEFLSIFESAAVSVVTFDCLFEYENNGTITDTITAQSNSTITIPDEPETWRATVDAAENGVYRFKGWLKSPVKPGFETYYMPGESYVVTKATRFSAVWEQLSEIRLNPHNGDTLDSVYFQIGGRAPDYDSLPVPQRAGYTFSGWYVADGERYESPADLKYNAMDYMGFGGSLYLYARWIKSSYTITFMAGNTEFKSVTYERITWPAASELPTPPIADGKVFRGWFLDKQGLRPYEDIPAGITSLYGRVHDLTLYAKIVPEYELLRDYTDNYAKNNPSSAIKYPLGDSVFAFDAGACVSKYDVYRTRFRLRLTEPSYEYMKNEYSYSYTFTLYRAGNDDTTATPLVQFFHAFVPSNFMIFARKTLNYYSEDIGSPNLSVHLSSLIDQQKTEIFYRLFENWDKAFTEAGYDVCFLDGMSALSGNVPCFEYEYVDGVPTIPFTIVSSSPYAKYFVRANVKIQHKESVYVGKGGFLWLEKKYEDRYVTKYENSIDSNVCSVYSVLNDMNTTGALQTQLNEYPDSVAEAQSILRDAAIQRVQIKYLSDIPDTPFATSVITYVEVPVSTQKISVADVALALGVVNLNCLGSPCNYFEYDSASDMYIAHYLKNVWLSAKTVDGNSANYFLDCNLSYYDYYYPFVADNVFSRDLYDYIFGQIVSTYPAVNAYTANEVYGYFGYVVIPHTYTLNALWAEMFNTKTTFDGVVKNFQYNELLKYSAYMTLLDQYDYTWLEKAWNSVAGFVSGSSYNAEHYLFYAELGVTDSFIAENGANDIMDNDSLISNDVTNSVGGVWDGIKDFFSGVNIGCGGAKILRQSLVILLTVFLVVLFIRLVIFIIRKIRGKK